MIMRRYITRIEDYLFQPQTRIDIHESFNHRISRKCLWNMRVVSWMILTVVLVELMRVDPSLFEDGFILSWLYFGLLIHDHFINIPQQNSIKSPKIKHVAEVVFELAISLEVPITVIEWSLLFADDIQTESDEQIIAQVLQHSVPIILLLIDLVCNSCRFMRRRLLFVGFYSLVYLIINLSYSLAQQPVYDIITWKDVWSYLYVIAVTIMIVGTHILGSCIYGKFKTAKQQNQNAYLLKSKQLFEENVK